jgi:hypothetical protein
MLSLGTDSGCVAREIAALPAEIPQLRIKDSLFVAWKTTPDSDILLGFPENLAVFGRCCFRFCHRPTAKISRRHIFGFDETATQSL